MVATADQCHWCIQNIIYSQGHKAALHIQYTKKKLYTPFKHLDLLCKEQMGKQQVCFDVSSLTVYTAFTDKMMEKIACVHKRFKIKADPQLYMVCHICTRTYHSLM